MSAAPQRRVRTVTALAVVTALSTGLPGCVDVRSFDGRWSGPRVGDDPVLAAGFAADSAATLEVETVDLEQFRARFTTSGDEFQGSLIQPSPAAEADVLAGMTFAGDPVRVYVAFASPADGTGDALVITALYSDPRVEVRVLRGNPAPMYAIFSLERE